MDETLNKHIMPKNECLAQTKTDCRRLPVDTGRLWKTAASNSFRLISICEQRKEKIFIIFINSSDFT